jgi:hypothetical protein
VLLEDWARVVADWGEAAVYRRVTEVFDPLTAEIAEAVSDTNVTVLVGTGEREGVGGEAVSVVGERSVVLIEREELPEWPVSLSSRLVIRGVEWSVEEAREAGDGVCVELRLVRA